MLSGDRPASELTQMQVRGMLYDHAHASRSKSLSYHDVAQRIGQLVTTLLILWGLLRFPGAPRIRAWWWREVVEREELIATGLVVMVMVLLSLEMARGQWLKPDGAADKIIAWPALFATRLVASMQLMLGVAAIGIVAIVPGAYVVFVLNLTGP